MERRIKAAFDERITSERAIIRKYLDRKIELPTKVSQPRKPTITNPVSEEELGTYRKPDARKAVTTDMEVIDEYARRCKGPPSFLEAGPRSLLAHEPQSVKAAIVTTGGLAPGLNYVVHSIVNRHWNTYKVSEAHGGGVFGVYESFIGLCNKPPDMKPLKPSDTEGWLDKGGAMLGIRRYHEKKKEELAAIVAENLMLNGINILYILGGDGSLDVAHEIAMQAKDISVVGIPKTMDNDVLWVWQSFGFRTAVEKATEVITTMNWEAESTRRVCLIELFGAESGFVAANASLASGHVDLVLIPEEFKPLSPDYSELALSEYVQYLSRSVRDKERPHAVVVLAEGVAQILREKKVTLGGQPINADNFVEQLKGYLQGKIKDKAGREVDIFTNQPRHNIRAIQANSQDQIYCERLGALAVDNALAGYTDFMISQWLTEYVLVPLELVNQGKKSIPPGGIFWKQVVSSTGQPCISLKKYQLAKRGNTQTIKSKSIRNEQKPARNKRSGKKKGVA